MCELTIILRSFTYIMVACCLFLVNLKTLFWYNKFQNQFLYGILKIKQFYLSSSSKTFQKMLGATNILRFYAYALVLRKFSWKIRDWSLERKNNNMGSWKHKQCLSQIAMGPNISEGPHILRTSRHWFLLAFLITQRLSLHKKC